MKDVPDGTWIVVVMVALTVAVTGYVLATASADDFQQQEGQIEDGGPEIHNHLVWPESPVLNGLLALALLIFAATTALRVSDRKTG